MKHEVTLRIYKPVREPDPLLGETWRSPSREFHKHSRELYGGTVEIDWYNPDSDVKIGEQVLVTDMGRFRLCGLAIQNGVAESFYELLGE